MTGDSHVQPSSAAPYQHVCPEADCIYYGQPTSSRACGCHRTREQMMLARLEELEAALRLAKYALSKASLTDNERIADAQIVINRALPQSSTPARGPVKP